MMQMTDEYIVDENVVDRYVTGRLKPPEEEAFEIRLLTDDELQRDVMAAESIADCLAHYAPRSLPKAPKRNALFAIAASALIAVGISSTLIFDSPGNPADPTLARVMVLSQTRGLDDAEIISITPDDEFLVLTMYPAIDGYDAFRARVESWDTVTWRGPASPGNDDAIAVVLHSSLLESGEYALQVEGRKANGEYVSVGRVSFQVERQNQP